jgi:NAD(P)H dehydrogenase (quinone)
VLGSVLWNSCERLACQCALVRQDDERAVRLRDLGAEVVIADLKKSEEVLPAVKGCRLVFFSTSVASNYLEASVVMAAAARANPGIELLINLSQMTISSMDLTHVTESP